MRALTPALLLGLAALAPALPSQQLTWLRPVAGGAMDVVMEPEAGGTPTTLVGGVDVRPIDITGRTLQSPGQPDGPRLMDTAGLPRIELPDGSRVLRLFRAASQEHLLLHVARNGQGRIVLTTPETVPGTSPWAPFVGAATDGKHLLIPGSQTGLWIVRLDGQTYPSTGTAARLIPTGLATVETLSCFAGPTHGFYHTDDGRVWRVPLGPGGVPLDVTPMGAAGDEPKEEMAISGDGLRVVFLFGDNKQLRVFRLDTAGPAVALPFPPAAYEEPDYLPAGAGHPRILLNHTGSRLLIVDATIRDEWYLVDPDGVLPAIQFTADNWFVPYIGVGIWPLFYDQRLVLTIGDPNRMDWFAVDLQQGVTNLSLTGNATPPFIEGTVDPSGALGNPGAGPVLALETTPTGQDLRRVQPGLGGSSLVLQNVQRILPPATGRAEGPLVTVLGDSTDHLVDRSTGTPVLSAPPGVRIGAPTFLAGGIAGVARLDLGGGVGLPIGYAPGTPVLLGTFEVGLAQVGITPGNRLLLSGGSGLRLLGVTGLRVVSTDGGARALSGLGV